MWAVILKCLINNHYWKIVWNIFFALHRRLICRKKIVAESYNPNDDEDVTAERLRVNSGAASADILQVNQLSKIYQHLKRRVHAVNGLSVGIPAGEVRVLLSLTLFTQKLKIWVNMTLPSQPFFCNAAYFQVKPSIHEENINWLHCEKFKIHSRKCKEEKCI